MTLAPSFTPPPPTHHTPCINARLGGDVVAKPPTIVPIHTTRRTQFSAAASKITTPAWRFILLSDGHIHNLLSHLVEHPLTLTVHHTQKLANPPKLLIPDHEQLPTGPCIRRMITLNHHGIPLLHATSLWTHSMYHKIMLGHETTSLYEIFIQQRLEVSRAILALHYCTCQDLAPIFGVFNNCNMWARDYVFRQNGVPFLIVQEVLSPRLQKYLGDIVPPEQITNTCFGAKHALVDSPTLD